MIDIWELGFPSFPSCFTSLPWEIITLSVGACGWVRTLGRESCHSPRYWKNLDERSDSHPATKTCLEGETPLDFLLCKDEDHLILKNVYWDFHRSIPNFGRRMHEYVNLWVENPCKEIQELRLQLTHMNFRMLISFPFSWQFISNAETLKTKQWCLLQNFHSKHLASFTFEHSQEGAIF